MGLLVDTNVLISFERKRITANEMLQALQASYGNAEIAVSSISALELAHGIARAKTLPLHMQRRTFLDDMYLYLSMIPVSNEIAERAGMIEGKLAIQGLAVDLADLLIGVTALQLDYAVLTHNTRHFELIPGLEVVAPTFTL